MENAKKAYQKANIPDIKIAECRNLAEAKNALMLGNYIVTDNPSLLFDLDVDVIADATGVPEAGAQNAVRALEKGKHMVMINKETDSVLGPYLHKLFSDKGLVYTPVDGDQPAQLMQLVDWARLIGLEIICCGKSRDGEFMYDLQSETVTLPSDGKGVPEPVAVHVPAKDAHYLGFVPQGKAAEYMEKRAELLGDLPGAGGFDYCELVNIANSTGLDFDPGGIKCCTLRINELPIVYNLKKNGGILERENTLDIITLLRSREEASMGGGVFLVVYSRNDYSQHILLTKSLIGNYEGTAAVMVQPYHLCGVESATSLISTALLGVHTGSVERVLRYDLARVAKKDLPSGTVCTHDRDPNLKTIIVPAKPQSNDSPIPAHMLNRNRLKTDVKAGQTITYGMVEAPANSTLWNLRGEEEAYFLKST
jgi:predicted homoserine dehydrogenase-like protein